MPRKRRKLSQSKDNVRRRARYAESRAKSSISQRMRDANIIALQQQTIAYQQRRIAELEEERHFVQVVLGKEKLTPEEKAESLALLKELHFREYTPEERAARLRNLWPEVETLLPMPGQTRRETLLLWMQRNGVEQIEFWAEYRRRKGN